MTSFLEIFFSAEINAVRIRLYGLSAAENALSRDFRCGRRWSAASYSSETPFGSTFLWSFIFLTGRTPSEVGSYLTECMLYARIASKDLVEN